MDDTGNTSADGKRSGHDGAWVSLASTPQPLRLLGMGLLPCWDWSLSLDLLSRDDMAIGAQGAFMPALVAMQALTLIALALLTRRLEALSLRPWLIVAGAVAGSCGPLSLAVAGMFGVTVTTPLAVTCALLAGFSMAILTLGWAEVYGRIGPGRVMLYGALSMVLGVCAYALIAQSTEAVRVAATFTIPLASFVCLGLGLSYVGSEDVAGRASERYTFPWKPVLIMGVCGFAAAFVDVALFSQGAMPHILADALVGSCVIATIAVLRRRMRPVALVGAALACMAIGIVSVAVFGEGAAFAASSLAMTSYVAITFFTFALLANMCYRRGIPSLWLFGFAAGARVLADHLGGFANLVFPQLARAATRQQDLAIMATVGLVVIGVVALMWMSERSFDSDWAVQTIDVALGTPVRSEREILLAGCDALAREKHLTEREAEILVMLADGNSYQQICSSLLLSPNTVKTHARHVYGKLGVHTREEAVGLAQAAGDDRQTRS